MRIARQWAGRPETTTIVRAATPLGGFAPFAGRRRVVEECGDCRDGRDGGVAAKHCRRRPEKEAATG